MEYLYIASFRSDLSERMVKVKGQYDYNLTGSVPSEVVLTDILSLLNWIYYTGSVSD